MVFSNHYCQHQKGSRYLFINFVKKVPATFLVFFFLGVAGASQEILLVPVGKTVVLPGNLRGPLHLSSGKIVKLREQFGNILATGISLGESTLTSSRKNFKIYVLEERDLDSYKILSEIVQKMMGLEASIVDSKVYIAGKLLRLSDWQALSKVSQEKNLRWVLKAKMTAQIQDRLTAAVNSLIENSNLAVPTISTRPALQITVSKQLKNNKSRYNELLEPLGFQIIEDAAALELEPMVDLKVQIVELKKSSFTKLGIDLPQSYQAQVLPNENFKIAGAAFDIALNIMEQDGSARIIASPHLSCRSGKEANFLAGGEFPIKIMNFQTNEIQWKKHGILLNFKPLADRSGKMSMSLTAEISMIDQSQAIDGVPGILVNRVSSHLDLKNSQTIALSGLIREHFGKSSQGIIGLKNLPILGALFSSEDYREERTDLVVFVTPQVLKE